MDAKKFHFGRYVGHGSESTIDVGNYEVTARVVYDEDAGTPWDNEDGHGPVSKWTNRPKRPGELVLQSDRGGYRYYDYAEAVKIAKRDGWGWLPGKLIIERDGEGMGGRATCGDFTAYDAENFNNAISEVYRLHKATMSPRQYAAKAALRDYNILKAWCNDEWFYCGIVLSVLDNGHEISDHAASVWGIECNYPDSDNNYLAEVAEELLPEALAVAAEERKHLLETLSD